MPIKCNLRLKIKWDFFLVSIPISKYIITNYNTLYIYIYILLNQISVNRDITETVVMKSKTNWSLIIVSLITKLSLLNIIIFYKVM